jgi:hypothetical protein
VGSVRLCDRCSGWLGTIWVTEKVSIEREREQRRGVWLGVTSWGWLGTVRKRANSERERAEIENERSEMVEDSRETHACFGKWFTEKIFVNRFPYFTC